MYIATALALVSLLTPAALAAQSFQSSPWEPWYGCWRAENAAAGESVCILPEGAGIRMVTLEDGEVRGDARIYADEVERQREQAGCTMDEWARWSADRERVFLTSELTCDGRVTRRSQGLLAFTGPDRWLSVQTIAGEDGKALRTVRFSPAYGVRLPAGMGDVAPVRALRTSSIASLDESDVVEATDVLDPETVQEWLRVSGAPFQVSDAYDSNNSSALDDLAYISQPVEYRTVNIVRILEPDWCIYGSCSWLRSTWCWDPWGYDRFAWHVVRPIVYWRPPVLLHVGINLGFGHGIRIARYDGWGRGRDWWRNDYPDRWRNVRYAGRATGWARSGGSVGSDGYRPPPGTVRPATGRSPSMGRAAGTDVARTGSNRDGTIRGPESRSGATRGTAVVRGTAGSRGYSAGGDASRGTAIVRGTGSRATVERGSSSGRSDAPGIGSYRGTAVGRAEPRASAPRTPSMTRSEPRASTPRAPSMTRSEPRASAPRAPSVSRGGESRSGGSRGTVSGRGYSPGGSSRGTARPRQ